MICQEEALLTEKLFKEKLPIDEIRKKIIEKFK
jgi:hypothetical protein